MTPLLTEVRRSDLTEHLSPSERVHSKSELRVVRTGVGRYGEHVGKQTTILVELCFLDSTNY